MKIDKNVQEILYKARKDIGKLLYYKGNYKRGLRKNQINMMIKVRYQLFDISFNRKNDLSK